MTVPSSFSSTHVERTLPLSGDLSTSEPTVKIDSDSRIERHPDAATSNEEACCLVRCFIVIKTQILRFFNWLCSLCSSEKSLNRETSETKKNDGKNDKQTTSLQTDASASQDKMSSQLDTLASNEEIQLVRNKIAEETIGINIRARIRFNSLNPNLSDEGAVISLASMIKIEERMYDLRKIDNNLESDPMFKVQEWTQLGKSDPVTKRQLQEENEKIAAIVAAIPNDLEKLSVTSVDPEMEETVKKFTTGELQYNPYRGPEELLAGLKKPFAERLLVVMNKIRADTGKKLKPLELPDSFIWEANMAQKYMEPYAVTLS